MIGKIKNITTNLFSGKNKENNKGIGNDVIKGSAENNYLGGVIYPVIPNLYNGEKTVGELGVVVKNVIQHRLIRIRAYDAYLKTETAKLISEKFSNYVVGSGMKFQCTPNKDVLKIKNIDIPENFSKDVEELFNLYASSKMLDYEGMTNLHRIAHDTFLGAYIGGDMLVVNRFTPKGLKVQVFDGEKVVSPLDKDTLDNIRKRGNYIENGVEFNGKGKHVAFYVRVKSKDGFKISRIRAYGANDTLLAWMVYGDKHRREHKRGISRLSGSLEKINKLDRYSEAAVSNAENSAKILMSIEHDSTSTGENPYQKAIKNNISKSNSSNNDGEDVSVLADQNANKIMQSVNSQVVNMPIGAKLKSFESSIQTAFGEFYETQFKSVTAAQSLPPEVANLSFNSNYTAAKAALDGWQFVIDILQNKFVFDFYNNIYRNWLLNQILEGDIIAKSFLTAYLNNDTVTLEAFYGCKFIGKRIPHVDPSKQIKAVRAMLGNDNTPLISHEDATEIMNGGKWKDNMERYSKEDQTIKELNINNNTNTTNE